MSGYCGTCGNTMCVCGEIEQVHTFGVAKYVYASAYDKLEAENAELQGKVTLLERELKLARGHIDLNRTGSGDDKEGGTA